MGAYPQLPTINSLAFVAYSGARIVFDRYYVTGQPPQAAFEAMRKAGITSVVSVRMPGEAADPPPFPPPPPVDPNEGQQLAALGISYENVPITRTMTQPDFNACATQAALAVLRNGDVGPTMVHCSTGDRASSVFAVVLILAARFSNADAVDYATNSLLLANPQVTAHVRGYTPPNHLAEQIRDTIVAFPRG